MSNKGFILILIGSIGAALAATACCLGPLVLVSLGLGGAWLSRLSALGSPFFMLLAFGFIVMGFYRSQQQAQVHCEEGSLCAQPAVKKSTRAALWFSVIIVSLILAGPYLAPRVLANHTNKIGIKNQKHTVFQVSGMSCVACTTTIETALYQVKGVIQVHVSLTPPEAKISYDPQLTNSTEVLKATQNVGYSAREIKQ